MVNLLQFDRDALGDWCEQQGEQPFRATQLFRWIHQRGARDFAAMTDLAKIIGGSNEHSAGTGGWVVNGVARLRL